MGTFSIEGGHKLKGNIQPQGAKNEALQVICACLLTSKEILIDRWLQDQKLTLHELADKYGVSAERIRQIEKAAMEKVKSYIS